MVRPPCFDRYVHWDGLWLSLNGAHCSMENGGALKDITQAKLWRDVFGLTFEATLWKNNEVIAQEIVDDVQLQIQQIPR